jgi:hypothetical protein
VIATRNLGHEHTVGLLSRLPDRLERLRIDKEELSTTLANLDQGKQMTDKPPFDQATRLANLRRR